LGLSGALWQLLSGEMGAVWRALGAAVSAAPPGPGAQAEAPPPAPAGEGDEDDVPASELVPTADDGADVGADAAGVLFALLGGALVEEPGRRYRAGGVGIEGAAP
jgi:hypothetical protein